ncbi:MAG: BatD family protein [Alphaproteobacteria bacterium]|nr:BatD family protein [Alphaproteobacteria bacterium]
MKKAIIFFFGLLFLSDAAISGVTADVEKQTYGPNEPIVLKITSDDDASMSPDLSVLKDFFNVVSTAVSRQVYITNGQKTIETTWELTILPNKKGKIVIPQISLGTQKTKPITIEISDAVNDEDNLSSDENTTKEPLYKLQADVKSKKEPFVQQKIDYVVKLTDEGQLQNLAVEFEPTTDFIIKQAGEPQVRKTAEGKREITFLYALFAQSSGKIKIPDVKLTGVVFQKPDINTIFGNGFFTINMPSLMGFETPISLKAKGEEIEVLPVPKNYGSKWWLPAEDVKISAKFVDMPHQLSEGSTLIRQITLTAVGLSDSQLPELELISNEDVKQYPEKPSSQTIVSANTVTGVQTTLDTIVVKKGGEIVLPQIKVPWYDVKTGEIKTAVLKEEKIKVLSSARKKPEKTLLPQTKETPQTSQSPKQGFSIFEIGVAFLAGIVLTCLFLKPKKQKKPKKISEKDIIKTSKKKDLRALRAHLIEWTSKKYQQANVVNLNDVATILNNEDLKKALDSLQRALYDENKKEAFDEKNFRKVFKKAIKQRKQHTNDKKPLPPLYE